MSATAEPGLTQWRAIEELHRDPLGLAALDREFPIAATPQGDRRQLLRLMGASLALAGLAGCSEPDVQAIPFVAEPEGFEPRDIRRYATATTFMGYAMPVMGACYAGRPIKLEGNPLHPAAQGASDSFTQAAILQLYDPDRSRQPSERGVPRSWAHWERAAFDLRRQLRADAGRGLAILTGQLTSPTLLRQLGELLETFPQARWFGHEPAEPEAAQATLAAVAGRRVAVHLELAAARSLVCFGADPLGPGPHQVRHGRGWLAAREAARERSAIPSLTVFESTPSLTGVQATERLRADASRLPFLLAGLAQQLGVTPTRPGGLSEAEAAAVGRAAQSLAEASGEAALLLGPELPASAQALAHRINARLGAFGRTIRLTEPIAQQPGDRAGLLELAGAVQAREVRALVTLEVDPFYTAPADLDIEGMLAAIPTTVHAGLYLDATGLRSGWHLPLAHPLESWSDARAVDGLATLIQPLVQPLYGGRAVHEIVASLYRDAADPAHALVQQTWRPVFGEGFAAGWQDALICGFVAGSAPEQLTLPPLPPAEPPELDPGADAGGLEILLRPDPTVWDGRFANLGWLQELPKPISKVTWQNTIGISPALARERGLETGALVELAQAGRRLEGQVFVLPGQADRTVSITMGYGHAAGATIRRGLGYDAFRLRSTAAPWLMRDASLRDLGRRDTLATTQLQFAMQGADFVRRIKPEALRDPAPLPPAAERPSLYPKPPQGPLAWAMAIDLDLCIGCNACVTACQAENNIPVVGKEQVAIGRAMHWLRVDHYYEGDADDPQSYFQPVPCMHCEQAPCEMGCPVNATVHSPEGLNEQVYNRCIGTRTCSSFCPYKVRRFNWYDYTSDAAPGLAALRNPEVTVRARGVMEKCTYCIQRIAKARITADREDRAIGEGEVVTACQQACPTSAIIFGNQADAASAVASAKAQARHYALLGELNTRPRTTYLAAVRAARPGAA